MKLLWENASPTSNFAAQTINLDLSDYDFLIIQYNENSQFGETMVAVDGRKHFLLFTAPDNAPSYIVSFCRGVTASEAGVVFEASWLSTVNSSQNGRTVDLIPFKIFGIKNIQPI